MAIFTRVLVAVAVCLSLLTTVISSPTLAPRGGKTISLPLAHSADIPRHGPTEYLKTLKKYNITPPEGLQGLVDEHKASSKAIAGGIGKLKYSLPTRVQLRQASSLGITNTDTRRFCAGWLPRWRSPLAHPRRHWFVPADVAPGS